MVTTACTPDGSTANAHSATKERERETKSERESYVGRERRGNLSKSKDVVLVVVVGPPFHENRMDQLALEDCTM